MDLKNIWPFKPTEEEILANKKNNVIYVSDFSNNEGKYISVTDKVDYDINIKLSPKIEVRITYITKKDEIRGVKISKLLDGKIEEINLSTMGFERVLQFLKVFSEMDLKSLSSRSLILDKSIIKNEQQLIDFLNLIAKDPLGKEKLAEIAKNYSLLNRGDIDDLVDKKEAVGIFDRILNNNNEFEKYRKKINVSKKEEVWQRFFKDNSWILGSDYVEILDERTLDTDNITDYLLRSYDGFVDIVELKLPTEEFWTDSILPRSELTAAIMQCARYILETERRMNDHKQIKKLNNTPIAKPRITLLYGKSDKWKDEEKETYRVLNSSYHNITIMTYDHILERAKRMLGYNN